MSKKIKVVIMLVALVLIAGAAGLWSWHTATQKEILTKTLNPVNGQIIGEKMVETNPFKTEVNPYEAYKNPFKQ